MELGLFTCGYQYTNIESAFIDAAAFGYDFIELWGGRPHAWAPDMDAGRVEIHSQGQLCGKFFDKKC